MIRPKKSLGQNFLIDKNVLEKIIKIVEIKNKTILEIGPGTGNLTSFILNENPKKIYAVEKDSNLASILNNNFKNQLTIINDDILNINENLISKDKLTVFGNLPYNISTEILCKWILNSNDDNFWFDYLILMFQKEVADRIIAKFNTSAYGRLSLISNWKLDIKKIFDVKPESFSPKPKIDSTLLLFKPKKEFIKIKNPQNLEKISRIFFNHRRKMLKKPYYELFNGNLAVLKKLKINLNLRPQNLDCDTYYLLTNEYEKLIS
ncbi:MAG: ribosomal RNA small subunit methyltransferase A [Alphaproteobacteria bacterium]|nr:ribosomal RNA small subunit methyltransferase A [Alphaproteobacteria bacterium]